MCFFQDRRGPPSSVDLTSGARLVRTDKALHVGDETLDGRRGHLCSGTARLARKRGPDGGGLWIPPSRPIAGLELGHEAAFDDEESGAADREHEILPWRVLLRPADLIPHS